MSIAETLEEGALDLDRRLAAAMDAFAGGQREQYAVDLRDIRLVGPDQHLELGELRADVGERRRLQLAQLGDALLEVADGAFGGLALGVAPAIAATTARYRGALSAVR